MMQLINFEESADLFSWASDNFVELGEEALKTKAFFDVALSGGKTAITFFHKLRDKKKNRHLFERTRFFTSDERAVSIDSPESNAGNAWRELLLPMGLNPSQFFSSYDGIQSPKDAALSYQQKIIELLSSSFDAIPSFDLVYLGMGEDGHTASLFPHNSLLKHLKCKNELVLASKEAINNHVRISFMPSLILAAKNICMMVTGEKKAGILEDVLHGPLVPEELPAQLILRAKHSGIMLLTSF